MVWRVGSTRFAEPRIRLFNRSGEEIQLFMSAPEPPDLSSQTPGTWTVYRQDDNGNRFVVERQLSREEAERMAAEFEARGHKQVYWVEPDRT